VSGPTHEFAGWYTVIFERDGEAFWTFTQLAGDEAEAQAGADDFFRQHPEEDPRGSAHDLIIRVVRIATGSLMTDAGHRDGATGESAEGHGGEGGGGASAEVAAGGGGVSEPPRILTGMYTVLFERDGEIFSAWTVPARDKAAALARVEARCREFPEHDPRGSMPDLVLRVVQTTIPETYD
jgi:hypothetical protein